MLCNYFLHNINICLHGTDLVHTFLITLVGRCVTAFNILQPRQNILFQGNLNIFYVIF